MDIFDQYNKYPEGEPLIYFTIASVVRWVCILASVALVCGAAVTIAKVIYG